MIPLLEGWPTKEKEVRQPWGKTYPIVHQPSTSMLQGKRLGNTLKIVHNIVLYDSTKRIKESCNLIGQEKILYYKLIFWKNASVYLKINKSFILNYLLAVNAHKTNQKDTWSGIYPISFTNFCFWTKIDFSNVVKCRWESWSSVSSSRGSWWSPGGGFGGRG